MGQMAKPLVGITTYVTPAAFGAWEVEAALVPYDYVRAVERAGARALLVPPSDDGVEETLDALDGLIFSGGSDLDPALYGQEPHPETTGRSRERDSAELILLRGALERDLPVLAICRGSQVLNVALGGDLVQHLPDARRPRRAQGGAGSVLGARRRDRAGDAARRAARRPRRRSSRTTIRASAGSAAGCDVGARAEEACVEALEVPASVRASACSGIRRRARTARLFEALVARGGGLPRAASAS